MALRNCKLRFETYEDLTRHQRKVHAMIRLMEVVLRG